MSISFESSAFKSGESIPVRYTCEGKNISPPLAWRGVPEEARSLALICDDPDAPRGTWSHWVFYNIPSDREEIPENFPRGGSPEWGGMQGRNDFGNTQYGGPCPPAGSSHRYFFRLYALDEELNLEPGATRAQVMDAMQEHIVDQAEIMGRFSR